MRTKGHLRSLVDGGQAIPFAYAQYAMGHECDNATRWLHARRVYQTRYRFGCEPYLLVSRRHSPQYHEGFVGYGKDRVSYTYELAARGAKLLVQPELFLVHFTTVQRRGGYSHSPRDWMVGETCWPSFHAHVRAAYNFEAMGCNQPLLSRQVARAYAPPGASTPTCVAQLEGLCVGGCQPATATFAAGRVTRAPRTGTPLRVDNGTAAAAAAAAAATSVAGGDDGAGAYAAASGGDSGELPSVYVLGCEACGSSAVAALLDVQPNVSLGWPLPGEPWWRGDNPSFFSQEDLYSRGVGWYAAHFRRRGAHDATTTWVDGSKGSLAAPYAAARLKMHLGLRSPPGALPPPKLVAVLHDPVSVAWALWRGLGDIPREQTRLRALLAPYRGSGNFTHRALKESAALARCFADARKAARRTAAAANANANANANGAALPLPSTEAWQRCVAVGCGWPNCVVGAGMFALQLRAWRTSFAPRAPLRRPLASLRAAASAASSAYIHIPFCKQVFACAFFRAPAPV